VHYYFCVNPLLAAIHCRAEEAIAKWHVISIWISDTAPPDHCGNHPLICGTADRLTTEKFNDCNASSSDAAMMQNCRGRGRTVALAATLNPTPTNNFLQRSTFGGNHELDVWRELPAWLNSHITAGWNAIWRPVKQKWVDEKRGITFQRELPCGDALTWPGERPRDIGWCPEGTDSTDRCCGPSCSPFPSAKPEMEYKPYLFFFWFPTTFLLAKGFRFYERKWSWRPLENELCTVSKARVYFFFPP
jgi:hypothetical protein